MLRFSVSQWNETLRPFKEDFLFLIPVGRVKFETARRVTGSFIISGQQTWVSCGFERRDRQRRRLWKRISGFIVTTVSSKKGKLHYRQLIRSGGEKWSVSVHTKRSCASCRYDTAIVLLDSSFGITDREALSRFIHSTSVSRYQPR